MTPTTLQIFATLFSLFALSRVFLRLKEHQLMVREALFWGFIWLGVIVVVWVPTTAFAISGSLGLSTREPIDTLVYISIILVFYLVYRVHVKQERLEHELTRLVRLIGIQQAEQDKKGKR